VVVSNHSSPMDIPALLLADPDVRFMAAEDLFRVPLLASAMRALDTVPIDRHDSDRAHRQLDELVAHDHLCPERVLVVFPEGGIAPLGGRLPFKSGAFSLAIRTASTISPVAMSGTGHVLRPHGRLAVRPGVVTVEFLDVIETVGLKLDARHILRDHVEHLVCEALGVAPARSS
jgi:1-acyl-sn-glycerol-3-phosphate acyltransferase